METREKFTSVFDIHNKGLKLPNIGQIKFSRAELSTHLFVKEKVLFEKCFLKND